MKKMSVLLVTALVAGLVVADVTSSSLTGTVARYLLAPRGEIDGFLLKDGTAVKFPPHLGDELKQVVKAGDTVTVALEEAAPALTKFGRGVHARSVSNNATGKSVADVPPTAPPGPPPAPVESRTQLSAEGKVANYLLNERGEIDGLILSEGTEVKFPPHIGTQLLMQLQTKTSGNVSASGPGMKTEYGTVIDATSLSYNGNRLAVLEPRRRPRP